MNEINEILERMAASDPNIACCFRDVTSTPMTRFPQGFRWHYYDSKKSPRFRQNYFCWSITRNENGKFLSWVYDWKFDNRRKKEVAHLCMWREHVRKKDAMARAHKMHEQRQTQVSASMMRNIP